MPHAVLAVNPFNVMLQLYQEGTALDRDFSFWLRSFRDPPIRTVEQLIEKCPRVDWLFWFLERAVRLEYIEADTVIVAGHAVHKHLARIASGECYTKLRGVDMPHTEGLRALREVLARTLN